jgi:hypothetical protein
LESTDHILNTSLDILLKVFWPVLLEVDHFLARVEN